MKKWLIKFLGGYTAGEMRLKHETILSLELSLLAKQRIDTDMQALDTKMGHELYSTKSALAVATKQIKTLSDRLAHRGRKIASLTEKLGIAEARYSALEHVKFREGAEEASQ